jgi:hydrogenase nickel incorporation protein HypB
VTRIVELRRGLLEKNDELARALRVRFTAADVRVSNWVGSPGSGKTTLLERVLVTAREAGLAAAALVGDCATDHDATRLARAGVPARQIVTEGMCHLEADLVDSALRGWDLSALDLLVVENVGNLVCPTAYDLGESLRVALLSVTEGEDKPAKYPQLYHSADLVVVTKIDLVGPCEWDREAALAAVSQVNPGVPIVLTSARTGAGVDDLLGALVAGRRQPVP